MKRILFLIICVLLITSLSACDTQPANSDVGVNSATNDTSSDGVNANGQIVFEYATEPAPQAEALGDSWDSFTIEINGKVLTLPCTYEALEEAGFRIRSDIDDSRLVNAHWTDYAYFEPVYSARENYSYYSIEVSVCNGYDEPKPLRECLVYSIYVSEDTESALLYDNFKISIKIPGGIMIDKTTREELLAAYGPATRETNYHPYDGGADWDSYIWELDETDRSYLSVTVDAETDLVIDYTLSRPIY